jgi:hypothetical protein
MKQSGPKPSSKLEKGQVPSEILDMVQDYLDLPDQICLALTCKHLYSYLLSYRKEKDKFSFNSILPRVKRFPLRSNTDLAKDPRIQLLHQLEDKYWEYCFECQILHRRSAKKQSHCYNGVDMHKHCKPSAGAVDLCPCLSITPNDRQLVASCLADREVASRVFEMGLYRREWDDEDITHECNVETYPGVEVEIETAPYLGRPVRRLSEKIVSFYVQNTYHFKFEGELSAALGAICPEKEPNKWLKQFFKEAGVKYSAWHGKVEHTATAPGYVKIVTIRELGYKNWGKWQWIRNRNDRD